MLKATNKQALSRQHKEFGGWGRLDRQKNKIVKKFCGTKVLDVGCGNGTYVNYLDSLGYEAKGCDLLRDKAWPKNKNSNFKIADIYNLPYKDKSFETAILFEVLEHLEHIDEAINELDRISSKNIILSIPNCDISPAFLRSGLLYYHYLDRTHINFFTIEKISNLLKQKNFQIDYITKINPVMPIILLLHNFYFPIELASVIGKIFQRIPFGRKFYTDIVIVFSHPTKL